MVKGIGYGSFGAFVALFFHLFPNPFAGIVMAGSVVVWIKVLQPPESVVFPSWVWQV